MTGKFVWYELMTTDPDAAEVFYREVIGWGSQDSSMTGFRYTLFTVDSVPVAGLMALTSDACAAGARPGWLGYVAVENVDAFVERAKAAHGTLHHGPADIPGVGRFAVLADPQGAAFALFQPATQESRLPAQSAPGHVGWHELHAADWQKAFDFYSGLFGWKKNDAIDMGAMGTYQLFALEEPSLGGMFNKPAVEASPYWLFYINVPAIDAAAARVKDKGGKLINGPHQVPGGSWIIQCLDPQGAMFALVAPQK